MERGWQSADKPILYLCNSINFHYWSHLFSGSLSHSTKHAFLLSYSNILDLCDSKVWSDQSRVMMIEGDDLESSVLMTASWKSAFWFLLTLLLG